MKNLILTAFISTVLTTRTLASYNYRKSPILASNLTQASCNVQQGAFLTFVSCNSSYEIYDTVAISQDPQELQAYGDTTTKLVSPRPTLEKNSDSRITYMLNTTLVMTAYEFNGIVYRKNLMGLAIPTTSVIADLWVFDYFVAV